MACEKNINHGDRGGIMVITIGRQRLTQYGDWLLKHCWLSTRLTARYTTLAGGGSAVCARWWNTPSHRSPWWGFGSPAPAAPARWFTMIHEMNQKQSVINILQPSLFIVLLLFFVVYWLCKHSYWPIITITHQYHHIQSRFLSISGSCSVIPNHH